MRKTIFLSILFSSVIIACTNDNFAEERVSEKEDNCQSIRSYDEAKKIACSAIKMLENGSSTRSNGGRRVSDNNNHVILDSMATRSESEHISDTLLYVFNYENNEGFAVVSANRNTDGLLAVTEAGNYDPKEQQETGGFEMFMQLAEEYVRSTPMGLINPDGPKEHMIVADTVITSESPRIQVMWGQRNPEGIYCPNGYSGCANTAAAMAMSYFEYPVNISYTYSGRDINSQNIDWTSLKTHIQSSTISSAPCVYCNASYPDSVHHTIGRICRQLGKLAGSTYNSNGSTTTEVNNIRSALSYLGYSLSNTLDVYDHFVYASLSNGILYVRGATTAGDSGHAWIADGYIHYVIDWAEYERPKNFIGPWTLILEGQKKITYSHYNWGYGGINNGYFSDRVYNMAEYISLDQNRVSNNGIGNYRYDVKYFRIYKEN